MDQTNSTAVLSAASPAELTRLFPLNTRPFGIWFNDTAADEGSINAWAVNDERGECIADMPSLESATTLSEALWDVHSRSNGGVAAPSQPDRRAGAFACIVALHRLQQIAEGAKNPDLSVDDQYREIDLACKAITDAVGPSNPFADGFIATLAEYIYWVHVAGTPNLVNWKSLAAMTEHQKVASRREIELAALE